MNIEKYDLFELGAGREMLRVEYTGYNDGHLYEMLNLDWPRGAARIYMIPGQEIKNGITCKRVARVGRHPVVTEAINLCSSEAIRDEFVKAIGTIYECVGDAKEDIEAALKKLPLELRQKLDTAKRCEHCSVNFG